MAMFQSMLGAKSPNNAPSALPAQPSAGANPLMSLMMQTLAQGGQ